MPALLATPTTPNCTRAPAESARGCLVLLLTRTSGTLLFKSPSTTTRAGEESDIQLLLIFLLGPTQAKNSSPISTGAVEIPYVGRLRSFMNFPPRVGFRALFERPSRARTRNKAHVQIVRSGIALARADVDFDEANHFFAAQRRALLPRKTNVHFEKPHPFVRPGPGPLIDRCRRTHPAGFYGFRDDSTRGRARGLTAVNLQTAAAGAAAPSRGLIWLKSVLHVVPLDDIGLLAEEAQECHHRSARPAHFTRCNPTSSPGSLRCCHHPFLHRLSLSHSPHELRFSSELALKEKH
ncbi:hypothetical protein Mapa_008245 [Marchantia paleacea]|nr:hypothetical protein Mapa_008245 [Marchantia paleacea]